MDSGTSSAISFPAVFAPPSHVVLVPVPSRSTLFIQELLFSPWNPKPLSASKCQTDVQAKQHKKQHEWGEGHGRRLLWEAGTGGGGGGGGRRTTGASLSPDERTRRKCLHGRASCKDNCFLVCHTCHPFYPFQARPGLRQLLFKESNPCVLYLSPTLNSTTPRGERCSLARKAWVRLELGEEARLRFLRPQSHSL